MRRFQLTQICTTVYFSTHLNPVIFNYPSKITYLINSNTNEVVIEWLPDTKPLPVKK